MGEPRRGAVIEPVVAFGRDGRILTTLGAGGVVQIWSPAGAVLAAFDAGAPVKRAGFVAGESRVYAATGDALKVWDVRSGALLATFPVVVPHDPAAAMVISGEDLLPENHAKAVVMADGQHAVVPVAGGLAVFEVASQRQLGVLPITGEVWSVIAGSEGQVVVIASTGASLFDVASRRRLSSLSAQGESIYDARFTADGRSVYLNGSDEVLRRWDATTGELLVTFEQSSDVMLFDVHPEGALLATFGDRSVSLWATHTGKRLVAHDTELGRTRFLQFTPDGRKVMIGDSDGKTWTWNLPSWTEGTASLAARLACRAPWQLVAGALKPRTLARSCK